MLSKYVIDVAGHPWHSVDQKWTVFDMKEKIDMKQISFDIETEVAFINVWSKCRDLISSFLWVLDECLGTNESLFFLVFVVVWRVGSKICSILIRDIHWISWNTKYLFVYCWSMRKNPFRKTSLGCKFCLTFDQRILTA